jgi:serine protease AprX
MNTSRRITHRRRIATIAVTAVIAALAPAVTVSAGGSRAPKPPKNSTTSTTGTAGEATGPAKLTGSDVTSQPTQLLDIAHQIGADQLWAAGYTGKGVDIALIDTGVAPVTELSHSNIVVGPDLSFEGGIAEVSGLDTYGHGTHMAGIIVGRTPGADPLAPRPGDVIGIAPDARLISVKVADNTGAADVSQVIAAIDWVVQHRQADGLNIRVLNLSYNTSGLQNYVDDPLSKAIENAMFHGITVVVSAGNEGRGLRHLANPATNPHVIAVSAAHFDTDGTWSMPGWAPSGGDIRNPDLVAPGVSVPSLRVPGSRIDIDHPGGRVTGDDRLFLGSGTSQAAAVTSGAVALLLNQRPELTPWQIKDILASGAHDTGTPAKFEGAGILDVAASARRNPPRGATVIFDPARGLGTLEGARGTDHVTIDGKQLVGEFTVTGAAWNPIAWVQASEAGTTWNSTEDFHLLTGSTWSGSTWSGSTWSGSTWSGSTWSGSTWSGSTWSGSTWSGSTWSGSTWSGSTWS